MSRLNECCCVVNQHCEAPANLEPVVTPRTKCADCEQRVCIALGCSILTDEYPLFKGKRVRVCADCCERFPLMARYIDAGIYEGSGYKDTAKAIREGREFAQWREKRLPWKGDTILCAATWADDGVEHHYQPMTTGLVFCGHRHHNIFAQMAPAYGKLAADRRAKGVVETQGFLTKSGRFVGREEALQIAIDAGQVEAGKTHTKDELFSEDLY
ncbi:hypothetical protein N9917_00490 [Deltaproteobacteria bacterium]|nr:hypothetical protein [Deltaproteobacteria bacterium]